MRLSLSEIEIIIKNTNKTFGPESKVFLFGSRVDDNKKGGDIDLFIETDNHENLNEKKSVFLANLEQELGIQKIDVVIQSNQNRLIENEAKNKGVELNIEKIKLQKFINECDKHLQRIEEAYNEIMSFFPLNTEKYTNLSAEQVRALDQYLYRFSKLQDTTGNKIMPLVPVLLREESNLPFLDILNRLEKLGFIESAREWIKLCEIRNEISHHYDDQPEETSVLLNNIISQKETLKSIYMRLKNNIVRYLK